MQVFGANENVKFVEAKLDNLEEVNDEITAMVTRMVEKYGYRCDIWVFTMFKDAEPQQERT